MLLLWLLCPGIQASMTPTLVTQQRACRYDAEPDSGQWVWFVAKQRLSCRTLRREWETSSDLPQLGL